MGIGRDRDGSDLGEFDGPLTDDMASEYPVGVAFDDELAEPGGPSVDDRAGRNREWRGGDHDVVILSCRGLAQAGLRVLGVGEAADRADSWSERQLAA